MVELSHRERVARVLAHEEPDRVPLDLMGHASLILDDMYFRLRDHLGIQGDIPPFREGSTANYYDERILRRFDIDFRRLMLPTTRAAKIQHRPDGSFTNYWGITYARTGAFVNTVDSPLREATTASDADEFSWPDARQLYHIEGLRDQAQDMYENSDYALVARNPLTCGFLDRSCQLRRMDQFLMDLILNPELCHRILDHLLRFFTDVYDLFLDAVGPYVSIVEFGDDLGAQNNLLISPATYREFIKPRHKALFHFIKSKAPHVKIFLHTDGAVFDIIPDLIEVGVDILNPIQTSVAGMDPARLKQNFGNRLVFHGAVEQKAVEGDLDDIVNEVKLRIDQFGPGGGYILAPCNHIIQCPPENVVALYETARQYGAYPLRGRSAPAT
jgi:uroporphyrinogen decarboxylase